MEKARGQTSPGKAGGGGLEQRWRWNAGPVEKKRKIHNSGNFIKSRPILISRLTSLVRPKLHRRPLMVGGVQSPRPAMQLLLLLFFFNSFLRRSSIRILCLREKERLLEWNTLPRAEETPEGWRAGSSLS